MDGVRIIGEFINRALDGDHQVAAVWGPVEGVNRAWDCGDHMRRSGLDVEKPRNSDSRSIGNDDKTPPTGCPPRVPLLRIWRFTATSGSGTGFQIGPINLIHHPIAHFIVPGHNECDALTFWIDRWLAHQADSEQIAAVDQAGVPCGKHLSQSSSIET